MLCLSPSPFPEQEEERTALPLPPNNSSRDDLGRWAVEVDSGERVLVPGGALRPAAGVPPADASDDEAGAGVACASSVAIRDRERCDPRRPPRRGGEGGA